MFCLESSDENRPRRTHCETLHAELASYHHSLARRLRTDLFIYGWILEASAERAGSSQGVCRCSACQPRLCTSACHRLSYDEWTSILPDKAIPSQAQTDLPLGKARIPKHWSLKLVTMPAIDSSYLDHDQSPLAHSPSVKKENGLVTAISRAHCGVRRSSLVLWSLLT